MKQGIHRVTPFSKQGRSMSHTGIEHRPWAIPKDVQDWNDAVDKAKREKKEAKKLAKIKGEANGPL